jgi:hypothetical protein
MLVRLPRSTWKIATEHSLTSYLILPMHRTVTKHGGIKTGHTF